MPKKKTILLADDEDSVLITLSIIFEREGYDVTTAKSGASAMKLLNERGFDAVITDLNMEKVDIGLEVAQAAVMKKPKPTVIVCTGYASVSNSLAALNMGVDYMVQKPVELESFISTLDRLLSLRSKGNRFGD
ncbi:MAG: response regulator [Acidobacteriota bacterium]|nr:response regulator [Acidobacteriota bacterium]